METTTVTTHYPDGRIRKCVTRNQLADSKAVEETYPWDWIDPREEAKVRKAIAAAAAGGAETLRYLLRASLFDGKSLQCETTWFHNPSQDTPVVGLTRTFMVIHAKLTKKEAELCKLLAATDQKSNEMLQRKKSTALRVAKSRLAKKLGIVPGQLPAFCAAYIDLF